MKFPSFVNAERLTVLILAGAGSVSSLGCASNGERSNAALEGANEHESESVTGPSSGAAAPASSAQSAPTMQADAAASEPDSLQPWLLVPIKYATEGELFVYPAAGGPAAGSLAFAGGDARIALDSIGRRYLLDAAGDRIVGLDPVTPWKARASWDVSAAGRTPGVSGSSNAALPGEPVGFAAASTQKGYAILKRQNRIAVLDLSNGNPNALPQSSIDLSSLLTTGDGDGSVDAAAATFANGRLIVALAHHDNSQTTAGGQPRCGASKPTIIAIDPTTDQLQQLVPGAATSGVALLGDRPLVGGMWFDAMRDRLLILHGGCSLDAPAPGSPEGLRGRELDAVDVMTGTVTKIFDLDRAPLELTRVGQNDALLRFGAGTASASSSLVQRLNLLDDALEAALPGAFDAITTDRSGRVVGIPDNPGRSSRELVHLLLDGGPAPHLVDLGGAPTGVVTALDSYDPH